MAETNAVVVAGAGGAVNDEAGDTRYNAMMKAFWNGVGSILNIFPTPVNPSLETPEFLRRSVSESLADDWNRIGADMRRAMDRAKQEQPPHSTGTQDRERTDPVVGSVQSYRIR